jgi:hypothetical protein
MPGKHLVKLVVLASAASLAHAQGIQGGPAIQPVSGGGTGTATAAVNTVFSGPSSGATAAPAFRSLVAADIPATGLSVIGTAIRMVGSNLPIGQNDLVTSTGAAVVPANKRWVVVGGKVYNPSAGNIIYTLQVKTASGNCSSVYCLIVTGGLVATTGTTQLTVGMILEAGSKLSVLTSTNAGLNLYMNIIEIPTTAPLKSSCLFGLSTGINTIYTVPAGKSAVVLSDTSFAWAAASNIFVVIDAGASRTVTPYFVPSGGSAGSTNQLMVPTLWGASSRREIDAAFTMAAGDSIQLNIDVGATTQLACVNVVEF